jgi:osmotically inducible protein OsmC
MKRTASAVWKGNLKEGSGTLTTQSAVLKDTAYSFRSRFGDGVETNPEELIAVAHAGCFSMALSMVLEGAGFIADSIETKALLTFDVASTTITKIDLDLTAKIPNITEEKFQEIAAAAKANCPVSKVLKAEISLNANLAS